MRHVVTRQVDQGVVIDDRIEVTVLEIGPQFVRIGVTDPEGEESYREHLLFLDEDPADLPAALGSRRFH